MRALLDVNVLVALLDPAHVKHAAAYDWFDANLDTGWAFLPAQRKRLPACHD